MFSGARQRKMKQGSKRKLSAAEDEHPKSTKVLCSDEKRATPCKKKTKNLSPSGKLKCSKGITDELLTKVNDRVIEEKENVQSDDAVAEQLNSGSLVEDSNDGIEVILVKPKDKTPKFSVQSTPKISSNKGIKKRSSKIASAKEKNVVKFQKRKRKNVQKPPHLNKSIDEIFKSLQGKQKKHEACTSSGNNINVMDLGGDSSSEESPSAAKSETDSSISPKSSHNSLLASRSLNSSSHSTDSREICSSKNDPKNEAEPSSAKTICPLSKLSPSKRKALICTKKKLTPAQKKKREELGLKKEQRLQTQIENKKKKQEQEEAKQILREERKRKKIEEHELKEKVKEEKRLKREEERLKKDEKKEEERQKKEEEKQKKEEEKQKKEEEKQKKEEEKQKKEGEKQRKEEERLLAKEELKREQQKRKAQFARFFVPKKDTSSNVGKDVESGQRNFILFQVKENMRMAPPVRSCLSAENRQILDEAILSSLSASSSPNYLKEIASQDYMKGQSIKTFPAIEPDDYCEILSDDEDIDGTDLLQENKTVQPKRKQRAKLLQFCENSRPAYYGTWSKKPAHITGRRPLTKEKVFDYDYDSDEDWEEVENGESLSDSDGEPEGEEAAEEDYEVDNDFFVPHGYLSDGEGEEKEDTGDQQEDEDPVDACQQPKDENIKEKLKQKQEEFELEMKQKTKLLKPKVYGCVWLGDQTSHPAYTQLVKILSSHRSQVMLGTCPLDLEMLEAQPLEFKDQGEEEEDVTKKFVKSFPEKAVADLIRLIHGNRYSKLFLVREFSEYWKRKQCEAPEEGEASSSAGCIAKRKIEPKIQEIAQYGKFSEDGVCIKYRSWYVPKEIRKKYGLEDLGLRNAWTYTLTPKEWRNCDTSNKEEKEESAVSDPPTPKSSNINLITKFTKVLSEEEEKKKLNAKFPSPKAVSSKDSSPTRSTTAGTPSTSQNDANLAQLKNEGIKGTPPSARKATVKKKIALTSLSKARTSSPKSSPIASFFKSVEMNKKISRSSPDHDSSIRKGKDVESEPECITVD